MSLVIEKFIICDECGETDGADNRTAGHSLKRLREIKKSGGWMFYRGKDYCDRCSLHMREEER